MKRAFVDESGDTGLKWEKGSSPYFILALIYFKKEEDLKIIDKTIQSLKSELGLLSDYEFKFSNSPDKIKSSFLNLIKKMDFKFTAVVVDKKVNYITNRTELYSLALYNAVKYSENCGIIEEIFIDEFFRRGDTHKVEKAILPIARMKGLRRIKIYQKDSKKDNLIQLADFVVGVLSRWVNNREDGEKYYEFIRSKNDVIIIK